MLTTSRDDSPKREAILAAALELFAERGFHGTAVPLIAERAKVGAGTVYRYFESKEAIVNALFQQEKGALGQALLQDFPFEVPVRQAFAEMWRRLWDFAAKNPLSLKFLELHHHGAYLDEKSKLVEMQMLLPMKGFVEQAQAAQVVKEGPVEVLMTTVWGAFVGMIAAAQKGYLEITPASLSFAEGCLWEAIRR